MYQSADILETYLVSIFEVIINLQRFHQVQKDQNIPPLRSTKLLKRLEIIKNGNMFLLKLKTQKCVCKAIGRSK